MQSHSKQQQNRKWLGRVSVHIIRKFQRLKRRPGAAAPESSRAHASGCTISSGNLASAEPVPSRRAAASLGGKGQRDHTEGLRPPQIPGSPGTARPRRRPQSGRAQRPERPKREQAAAPRPVSRRGMRARPCPDNQPRARAADTKPALRPRAPVTTHRGVSPRPPGRGRSQLPLRRRHCRRARTPARLLALPVGSPRRLACPGLALRWRTLREEQDASGGRLRRTERGGRGASVTGPAAQRGRGRPRGGGGGRDGPGAWAGPGAHATSARVASRLRPPTRSRAHAPSTSSDTPLRGGVGKPLKRQSLCLSRL